MKKYRNGILVLSILAALLALFYGGQLATASGTAAGTTIPNTASADYTDAYGVPQPRVSSPTATVKVGQLAGVSMTPTTGSASEKPGATAYFQFTLTNTGNGSDTFNLATSEQKGWSAKVIRDDNGDGTHQSGETTALNSTGSLTADTPMKAFLAVSIPTSATANTIDAVTLRATSTVDVLVSASATINVTANAAGSVSVTPATASASDKPGASVYSPVTITNTGGASDTFNLTATDTAAWAPKLIRDDNSDGVRQSTEITALTSTGSLAAGASVKAFVSVTIPTTAATGATDTATVRATSTADSTVTASATLSVSVTAATKAGVSITPATGAKSEKPGTASSFPLTITNTGTSADSFTLAVTDPKGWGAQFIRDDNADGIRQSTETTALTNTGSLAANATLKGFLALTVPSSATAGTSDAVALKATSVADTTMSASATITWSVASTTSGAGGMAPVWTVSVGGPVCGSPTIVDGIAYIGSDDGSLYAVAATAASGYAPGTVLWSYATGGAIKGRPFAAFDSAGNLSTLFFGSNDGCVYAVDSAGRLRWKIAVAAAGSPLDDAPALAGGILYVPTASTLVGLDPNTGQRLYTSPTLNGGNVASPIAVPAVDSVWVATDSGTVYCLNSRLSGIRWMKQVDSGVVGAPVYLGGGDTKLIVATTGGRIYSTMPSTGASDPNWGPGYRGMDGGVKASLWLDPRGYIYVGTTTHKTYKIGTAYGLAASSEWPYTQSGSGEYQSSALVIPGVSGSLRLYIAGMDGRFHASPADSPAAESTYDTGTSFVSSPAASGSGSNDVVVVGGKDGKIYAFPLEPKPTTGGAGVGVTPSSGVASDVPGATIAFPLAVTNTGTAADTFGLAVTDQLGWSVRVVRDDNGDGIRQSTESTQLTSTGSLSSGATAKCFLVATIPASAVSGTGDAVTVKATSGVDSTKNASSVINVRVTQPQPPTPTQVAGVSVSPSTGAKTEKAGTPSYFPVTITNTGNGADSFALAVSDPKGWGAQFIRDSNADGIRQSTETIALSNTGSLAAGVSLKGFLTLTVPATAAAGSIDAVSLKATSAFDATKSASATVTWTVASTTPSTGGFAPKWSVSVGAPVLGSPTIAAGVAFVGAEDGCLYAVAATTASGYAPGTVLWRYATGGAVRSRPFVAFDSAGWLSTIYFTSGDGFAYALNPAGALRWRSQVAPAGTPLAGTPILAGGVLYVSANSVVVGLDPASGQRMYGSPTLPGSAVSTPLVQTSTSSIWVGTDAGNVHCLDTKLSSVRWTTPVGAPVIGSPLLVGGWESYVIVATAAGRLYNLMSDRGWANRNWGDGGYRTMTGAINDAPTMDPRGYVYLGTADHVITSLGTAYGLRASDKWPYVPQGSGDYRSSPLVTPGPTGALRLYFAGMDGKFHSAPADAPASEVVFDAGAAFISSPAASGQKTDDVVVIGGTDGKVYGFPIQ